MKYLIITIAIVLSSSQVFAADLSDALSKALVNAEQDHKAKQVALDVEPEQVEKATFKRNQDAKVIHDTSSISADMEVTPLDEEKPASAEDFAQLQKELSDN